ncbi:MAG: hydantoinase B/oxoprolinase family protein [Nitriliruptorales bacterium]|nr:hydantoinase B/oxoprolinase family protein [Nitriliruptorales bacterium]
MWEFWIDRGGTFTDVVALTPDGRVVSHKLLSERPGRDGDAAVLGIRHVLGLGPDEPIPVDEIRAVRMGTTVATNALLERSGDRTVLVITKGFGDLLRIGYQDRPRLFDLDIRLPDLLHEVVIEADERVAADGSILQPLDEEAVRARLEAAFDDGIRSVAVALLHGWREPVHEQRVSAIAAELGFAQISVSHRTSPLIKLVSRGDTTVVDAYLSPLLARYVDAFTADLGAGDTTRVQFMQSSGGLTDAALFGGKDAILSGPAGGVVGMVETGRRAGFERLIGFDMGGTSTDVTHFDGHFERTNESEVAGVRLRSPMLHIHTVAAGGGSILHFDGARFRVGPDSAGADPGPAAYRRGGPLTVTDANVLLGRIQADHFPHVFGEGSQPVDVGVVRRRFEALAAEVVAATGNTEFDPARVADGFLRIAVENMANAIKKITTQRGHDVSDYALNCFGGAGGQHACLVADELEVSTILIHPLAGVLSALGMGLAEVRSLRQGQVSADLDADGMARAESLSRELDRAAVEELAAQGVPTDAMTSSATLHIRHAGSDQALAVAFGSLEAVRRRFNEAHLSRFGFVDAGRALVIEAVSVEAVGGQPRPEAGPVPAAPSLPRAGTVATVRMRSAAQWHETPLHARGQLAPGDVVDGPALIVEDTATTVVDVGWRAAVDADHNLVLTRSTPRPARRAAGTDANPVLLEVFNNLFMSIAEQMGATLASTAYSVNIKERLDFSCALFDADGNLVANAPHVPVHLGSMGASVRTVARRNAGRLRPGDAYLLNNPFDGGTHLPDVTVVAPVFDDAGEAILFWVGARGHHADIGGRTPGSSPPDSRTIDEEGIVIDNFPVLSEGRFREDAVRELLTSGRWPCRNVDQNIADLKAQLAATATGITEIRRMVHRYGLDVVQAYMAHVQANAEESVRRVIDVLADGSFRYPLDNGCHIDVEVGVDRTARAATIDFTGTSEQDIGNHNAPLAVCRAAVLYVFRTLVGDEIPLNDGCMRALHVIAPEGTIVNPRPPAAVVAGNTEVSQAITDALFGALGVVAGSQGTMNNFIYGNDRHQNYETICGGTGAGPTFDGASAVQSHMTNTRMTDPEVLEQRLPILVEEMRIRRGSGGAGRHRGGDGVVRRVRFLEPMTVTIVSSNRVHQPFGVAGGGPGASGRNSIERADGGVEELGGDCQVEVAPGDAIVMETPGGGGYGAA